ncbi:hypothetical protein PSACC_02679 [Paramicrosporidium saccamoebae]|uniref:Protein phosphatase n=1 Tax=Paramicrosporidium saccamoebae TaxID=1246581 RepID=A0A2H9TID1_9FUNG|nr:hypothetical protein PSACC_02679 [Paramicrosporidium saccamoebae]
MQLPFLLTLLAAVNCSSESISALHNQQLQTVLDDLIERNDRPTETDWGYFREICSNRKKQRHCAEIFDYFHTVLVPLEFPQVPTPPVMWSDWYGAAMPKHGVVPHYFRDTRTTQTFGDDSQTIEGDFMIVSDGITRDPDSDFFSFQIVEFLRVTLPRLNRTVSVEEELYRAAKAVEELLVEVRLPGAATLSAAYRRDNTLYVLTLGDSEARVVRDGQVVYRSPRQRTGRKHEQLAAHRPDSVTRMIIDAIPIQADDYVLLATDGLWDNLSEADVVAEVVGTVKVAARSVMERALQAKEGKRQCIRSKDGDKIDVEECVGGRRDDITVLIAKV